MPKGVYDKPVRPLIIIDKHIVVPLTKGESAIIDIQDRHIVEPYNWHAYKGRKTFYAARDYSIDGVHRKLRLHTAIMNTPLGLEVDHINGDGLDNRRCNLRLAGGNENRRNIKRPLHNTSGYKGVTWAKDRCKWQSQIQLNGKNKFLGYFHNLEEAAIAYDSAARIYHGEFARLNFPDNTT